MKPSQAFVLITLLACSQATSVQLHNSCKKFLYLFNNFMGGQNWPFPFQSSENAYHHYSSGSVLFVFPVEYMPGRCYAEVDGSQADITLGFGLQAEFSFPSDGFNLTASSLEIVINFSIQQKDNKMLPLQFKTIEIANIGKVVKHKDGTNEDITNEMKDRLKYILTDVVQRNVEEAKNFLKPNNSDNLSDTELYEIAAFTYAVKLLSDIGKQTKLTLKDM